jgi:hypothetical protein
MTTKLGYRIRSLFWFINRPFVKLFMGPMLNFVVAEGSDPMPRRSFVLVANHANILDPWIVGYQSLDALFIMMNDDGFRGNRFRAMYLHAIGAFGKKKGAHDYKAMKTTLQLLRGGYPVLIFPEGQTSWDGETQPVYGGLEKVIKRGKCPLVMVHLHGNFLSRPWWSESNRRGKIVLRIKVLDAPTVQAMPDQDVLEAIKSHIYNNDVKNAENRTVLFRGSNMAKGLERFVWICKHCKAEDALITDGNTITCTACPASWEIDPYCVLKPRMPNIEPIGDLHDWVQWHKQQVKERLRSAPAGAVLTSSAGVRLRTEGPGGDFIDRFTGTLELTRQKVLFAPQGAGAATMEWPLHAVEDYVIQLKDTFEFRAAGEYYRFVFDGHSPMKWIYYVRYMKGFEEIEKRGHY